MESERRADLSRTELKLTRKDPMIRQHTRIHVVSPLCIFSRLGLGRLFRESFVDVEALFELVLLHGGEAERLHEPVLVDDELDLLGMYGDRRGGSDFRGGLVVILRVAQTDAALVKVVVQLNRAVGKRLKKVRRDFRGRGGR